MKKKIHGLVTKIKKVQKLTESFTLLFFNFLEACLMELDQHSFNSITFDRTFNYFFSSFFFLNRVAHWIIRTMRIPISTMHKPGHLLYGLRRHMVKVPLLPTARWQRQLSTHFVLQWELTSFIFLFLYWADQLISFFCIST